MHQNADHAIRRLRRVIGVSARCADVRLLRSRLEVARSVDGQDGRADSHAKCYDRPKTKNGDLEPVEPGLSTAVNRWLVGLDLADE